MENKKLLEFCSGLFLLIVSLVETYIQLVEGPRSVSSRVVHVHGNSLLNRSRKQARCESENLQYCWHFRRSLESFLQLHRETTCGWYMKPKTVLWFQLYSDFVIRDDPERFKLFFRISPRTFYHICEMVHNQMLTNPPRALLVLPNRKLLVSRQVAIAIWRLSIGDQTLGVAKLFGVSCSTVTKVTWKFIQAMNIQGMGFIKWPAGSELEEVKNGFLERGFPACCGAIDGTHFPVELPQNEQSSDYFDYKHNISVSMQAIVHTKLRFLDVVAGWPGSIQDTRLLRNSKFYRDVVFSKSKLIGEMYVCTDGVSIREYILGDAGYPLFDWLIVPFPRNQGSIYEDWNHEHSSARIVVERAFGRLKGSWRILSRILWKPRKERIGPMIFTCCILHNLMIQRGDVVNPADIQSVTPHPRGYGPISVPTREQFEGGPEAREALFHEIMGQRRRR